jgi:murein L,D-transpeptidase YafK
LKTYKVSFGRNPLGDKEKAGDKRTPEGNYFINRKNPDRGYHKNLGASYPNAEDIRDAKEKGQSAVFKCVASNARYFSQRTQVRR